MANKKLSKPTNQLWLSLAISISSVALAVICFLSALDTGSLIIYTATLGFIYLGIKYAIRFVQLAVQAKK